MNWISTKEKHFVDFYQAEEHFNDWVKNDNCPEEPFLVGFNTVVGFDYYLVIYDEDRESILLYTDEAALEFGYRVDEVDYWCKINNDPDNKPNIK